MESKNTRSWAHRTVGRADLERAVASKLGKPVAEVREVALAFLNAIATELESGKRVEIRRFGRWEVRPRKARVVQHSVSLEEQTVPAHVGIHFRAGAPLKRAVQSAPIGEEAA